MPKALLSVYDKTGLIGFRPRPDQSWVGITGFGGHRETAGSKRAEGH